MIKRLVKFIYQKWKWRGKLKFGWSSQISLRSFFEGMNKVHSYTDFSGYMGYGTYLSSCVSLSGKIGRFCSIGPYVRSNNGRHPYTYPFVATAPCFFSKDMFKYQNGGTFATTHKFDEFIFANDVERYGVEVGSDCWIGEGAFIVGGVKIEDGAVVLAHAVVTKNVPAYAIVGGVPAKIIGYRYSSEDIEFLLRIRWWDNDQDWFKKNWELLTDFDALKKYYLNNADN